jgi:glyoxylase I family protein
MALEVTGVDHVFITVSDLRGAEVFYDGVMKLLGFRKGDGVVDGERLIHYYNRCFQYTLRQARSGASGHDPLVPGLNHLCFQVKDAAAVDEVARGLQSLGIAIVPPQLYPEYTPDYYALHFTDGDGIRLEVVNRTRIRDVICERWAELDEFENPLKKIGAI